MQIISFQLDRGLSLEQAFLHPRLEASGAKVLVSDQAPASVAAALAAQFPTEVVADTIYPAQFSVPSAVMRVGASNIGMSHHLHPWAGVAVA